ncbi:MAG: GGDEF domain-containing protein [Treponema sp.]|nr:GGDEF domain-containing protein [Treponema sp.]
MGLDLQNYVDGFKLMTCLVSVEKFSDGTYGNIRIVTGNQSYIQSIENNPDAPQMLTNKFEPNCEYTKYLPQDLNFEDSCYRSAVLKEPLHSYAKPDRFDFWFNMFFLPVDYEDGNTCYCTYSMEFTHEPDTQKMSETSYKTASDVLNTLLKLRGTDDFKKSMQEVIKDIRGICKAQYCCIMTIDFFTSKCSVLCQDVDKDLYESYKDDWFTESFFNIVATWEATIAGSNCLIIKNDSDMQVVKERNLAWYESLKAADVKSIVLFPLRFGYELLGYIWATNFDTNETVRIKETLELTGFFLGSEIANYQLFDRLRFVSTIDLLTGVLNRNEMNDRVTQLNVDNRPNRKNIGVVFADLNGLKHVNDNDGHAAGDALIKKAASMLRDVFPDAEIFRAGGDEFMVLMRDTNDAVVKGLVDSLKEKSKADQHVNFAVGYCVEEDCNNIHSAMKKADIKMYEDKKKYYEQFPERKR